MNLKRSIVSRCSRAMYFLRIPKLYYSLKFKDSPNICFIWIPKSAGTSIFRWLNEELSMPILKTTYRVIGGFSQSGPVTFGHMSYLELLGKNLVRRDFDDTAFKFTFVRNPFDRAISLYNYMKRLRVVDQEISFLDFLKKIERNIEPVGLYNRRGLSQCNPQVAWITDKSGRFIVDHIAKFEDFEKEVEFLADKLNINARIFHENKTEREGQLQTYYRTSQEVELVQRIYKDDFRSLGYSDSLME